METRELRAADGSVVKVIICQLEISKTQQVAAIGSVDLQLISLGDPHPEVDHRNMGKLSQQSNLFGIQLTNSLRNYEWDFKTYPDPQIILITKL